MNGSAPQHITAEHGGREKREDEGVRTNTSPEGKSPASSRARAQKTREKQQRQTT